jgi:hypothetical protein
LNFECVDLIGPQRRWMDGVGAGRGTDPPRGSAGRTAGGRTTGGMSCPDVFFRGRDVMLWPVVQMVVVDQ